MNIINNWKNIDKEQLREAPPSRCRRCGQPIYWERKSLKDNRRWPVDALTLEYHVCLERLYGVSSLPAGLGAIVEVDDLADETVCHAPGLEL